MLVQIFDFWSVEKLKWKLMNHRKSYLEFKNNLIGLVNNNLLKIGILPIYFAKNFLKTKTMFTCVQETLSDESCPICNSYASTDLYKDNKSKNQKMTTVYTKYF